MYDEAAVIDFDEIECPPVDRTYSFTRSGEEVRVLWVDRYDEEGNEIASYVYRLRNDDPRPKGRFCKNSEDFDDFLGTLPFGCWTRLVWEN